MSFLIIQTSRFIAQTTTQSLGLKNTVGSQGKVNKLVSNKASALFKGAFPPGKLSQKELKVLNKAECEIKDWNQAVLKARKGSSSKT